jgi:hypothetical protein
MPNVTTSLTGHKGLKAMPNNALAIVEEFLRAPDAQVRRNALTALAIFANDETEIAQLIEVALNDPEIEIRRRAEKEVGLLTGESLNIALRQLHAALCDKSTSLTSYALLGRLRNKGIDITTPELSLFQRLRLAASLHRWLYPRRDWQFHLRSWKFGLLGAILALFLLGFFLSVTARVKLEAFTILAFVTALLTPIAAACITQRTSPIAFQFDRFAAFLVEVGRAVFFSFLCSLLLVFILILGLTDLLDAMEVLIFIPLIVGSVRAGTILAHGIFRRQTWNLWAQIGIGSMTGVLVHTLITFLLWKELGLDRLGVFPYESGAFLVSGWAYFLPLSFCTATAFAFIDRQALPVRPVAGRAGLPACILIALLFLSLTSLVMAKAKMPRDSRYWPQQLFDVLASKTVRGENIPPWPQYPY